VDIGIGLARHSSLQRRIFFNGVKKIYVTFTTFFTQSDKSEIGVIKPLSSKNNARLTFLNEIRFKSDKSDKSEITFPHKFYPILFQEVQKTIMGSSYYEDEYEDYDGYDDYVEDYEPEVWGYDNGIEVVKAQNGQLYTVVWSLTRWEGQDWGEAEGSEYACSLNVYRDVFKQRCIELGKSLKPGESISFYWGEEEDEEEKSIEGESNNEPL
jgi:hypothetical protein